VSFLLDVTDWRVLQDRFKAYEKYLRSVEGRMADGAFAFAIAPWHYDASDPRCPHDAWVEAVTIAEPATGDRHDHRHTDIFVRLLGAYHDGRIELTYRDVRSYSLAGQTENGHGDWLRDEVRLSEKGLVLHEVSFASGSRWLIECADIQFEWIPLDSGDEPSAATA